MKHASLRRFLFRVHLVLGLALGLYLTVMGVTGTFLVFNREADTALNPYLTSKHMNKPLAPFSQIVAAFERENGGQIATRLRLKFRDGVWGATLDDKTSVARHIYVDPHTAQVVGVRTRTSTLNGWVSWLHFNLFAGDVGELLNGYGGILGVFLLLSGIYVWWPRSKKAWRNISKGAPKNATFPRRLHDVHVWSGIASSAALVLICVTGAIFTFKKPVQSAVYALTGTKEKSKIQVSASRPRKSWDELFQIGDRALPGDWVSSVDLPKKASEPFILRKNLPDADRWRGSVSATVDPVSGAILRLDNTRQQAVGVQIMEMVWPLHAGWWGGWPTKIFYALIGLCPLALTVSGCGKWALRKRHALQKRREIAPRELEVTR